MVQSALRDSDAGMRDADNAAKHGVAVKTVRRWRRHYQRRGLSRGQTHLAPPCPICDGAPLAEAEYAELLGWYLGDGHVAEHRRGVFGLHIINDRRYPGANARLMMLMSRVKPGGRPHARSAPGSVITTVSWKHWPCLLPQHGPGRKHERRIALAPWQVDLVTRHPGPFLRGLFHSDGCRVQNTVRRSVGGCVRSYTYPRWFFTNNSEDILEICGWALDLAGVPWRHNRWNSISVARKAAVAELDRLIGPKD